MQADVLFVRQLGDAVRLRGFMHPGTRVRVTGEAPKLEGSEAQLQVFTKAGERESRPKFHIQNSVDAGRAQPRSVRRQGP